MTWKRGDLLGIAQRLRWAMIVSIIGFLVIVAFQGLDQFLAAFGMGLAVWLVLGSLNELAVRARLFQVPMQRSLELLSNTPRSTWGMVVAHSGLGILAAGITGVSLWQSEVVKNLRVGDGLTIAGYELVLSSVDNVQGPNYAAERGVFQLRYNGNDLTVMNAEQRRYIPGGETTTEAAIRSTWMGDVYVTIGTRSPTDQSAWAVRAYYKPMVLWLWTGALLMSLGGLLSLSDRRLRIGVPKARRQTVEGDIAHA